MRRSTLTILSLVLASLLSMTPNSTHALATGEEVLQIVRDWNDAFASNDVPRYFTYIDEELSLWTPANPYRVDGLAQDREEFEFSLRSGKTWVNLFQMMQPRVQLLGDAAVVTYAWRGSLGKGDAASMGYFKETDVLLRRPSGWKIVHIHLSRSAP